jgi:hypothetical protein
MSLFAPQPADAMSLAWNRVMDRVNPAIQSPEEIVEILSLEPGMEEYSFRITHGADDDKKWIEVHEDGHMRHMIETPKPTTLDYMEASIGTVMGAREKEGEKEMGSRNPDSG